MFKQIVFFFLIYHKLWSEAIENLATLCMQINQWEKIIHLWSSVIEIEEINKRNIHMHTFVISAINIIEPGIQRRKTLWHFGVCVIGKKNLCTLHGTTKSELVLFCWWFHLQLHDICRLNERAQDSEIPSMWFLVKITFILTLNAFTRIRICFFLAIARSLTLTLSHSLS